jgi:hypothetical protein
MTRLERTVHAPVLNDGRLTAAISGAQGSPGALATGEGDGDGDRAGVALCAEAVRGVAQNIPKNTFVKTTRREC